MSIAQADPDVPGRTIPLYRPGEALPTPAGIASPEFLEAYKRLKFSHEATGGYLWEITPEGIYTYVSDEVLQVKGHPPAAFIGHSPFEFMPAEEVDGVRRIVQEAVAGKCRFQLIHSDIAANGEILWEEVKGIVKVDDRGDVIGLYGYSVAINDRIRMERELREVTAREQVQAERREALQRLQQITSQVPGLVYQFRRRPDGSTCLPFASEAIHDLFRLSPEDVREDAGPIYAILHPDDLPGILCSIDASARDLSTWRYEFRTSFPDGTVRWLFGNSVPQREADGSVQWSGFITDITEHKLAEQQLRVAATVFESQEGMFVTDAQGVIQRVNHAFTTITGYTATEAVGQTPRLLSSGRHDAAFYAAMRRDLEETGHWQGEIWNRRKNGECYPEWLTITAVKGVDDTVSHYVSTLTDITDRKSAEDQIRHLAFYDPLTQLPNRRLLHDRLQQAMAVSARTRRNGALLFIDLDNFKTLNDTLGHDIGDLLLQQVGDRLTQCMREGDTVARLGGDEFLVMLEDLSPVPEDAAAQAEGVGEKILASLNRAYRLAGYEHHNTPSIGITLFGGHRQSIDELLKRADIAMYEAKTAGRNTLRFFDPVMQAAVQARASLEHDLRRALAEGQFTLYYQVQTTHECSITGAEVLIRWFHPGRGLVTPGEFIPLAEETGLILPIGHWVLDTACAQLKAWESAPRTRQLALSVNVSAAQFRQPDFVAQVRELLDRHRVAPERIKLELTESLVLADVDDTVAKMHALRELGVRFSLDDFGTGYSSLSQLTRLPLDQLKIDQSFVFNIGGRPADAAIVQTIIGMADNLGISVIAEGVETEAQRAFLEQHGCYCYQGYLFGRPVPVAEFERMLH